MGLQSSFADINAALYAVAAVLAALSERETTRRGQHIDFSQLEAAIATVGEMIPQGDGSESSDSGEFLHRGHYSCLGDNNQWVAITARNVDDLEQVLSVVGYDTSPPQALDDRSLLDSHIDRWTASRSKEKAAQDMQDAGVPAAPLSDIEDRFLSEHFQRRAIYIEQDHPVLGREWIYALPWKSNLFQPDYERAPFLGEHNAQVLSELLELPDSEIDRLRTTGVIE
ncbi:MAG: hypothetical protein GEU28_05940 [Dehalococcoidia bacterium]|nr:hypothetical protein [Dehalococcoidia bacterium]